MAAELRNVSNEPHVEGDLLDEVLRFELERTLVAAGGAQGDQAETRRHPGAREDLRSCHTLRRGEKNAVAPAARRLTETPAAPGAFERQDVGGVGDDFRVPDRR